MITLITGAPRSGKTLYTVDKLIEPEIGRVLDIDDDQDGKIKVTRRILANINQLHLDHDLVDKEWLENIHTNRKVGDFIVFDEVQRVWPNRPAGSKIPPSVEYLQTHGHDAVDLVIMTQSPALIDPGVRSLVGRHLHVRKLGGMGAAIIYEWDTCSNALNFKNAFKKTAYRYSRKAQKLYKSAKGHTGSRAALPTVLWVSLVCAAGAAFAWPHLFDRLSSKVQEGVSVAPKADGQVKTTLASAGNPSPALPPVQPVQPLAPLAPPPPKFAGCAVARGTCVCYDVNGQETADFPDGSCSVAAGAGPVKLAIAEAQTGGRPSADHAADLAMIAWTKSNR